jgi:hypothetical protein
MRLSFKKLDLNKKFIFKLKTFLIINFQSPHRVLNSSDLFNTPLWANKKK